MKKEIRYFTIGNSYGGNQDWFTNIVMRMGGCAAATACDSCIYFAKEKGLSSLYPLGETDRLDPEAYRALGQKMKPYISPRIWGVKKLSWYIEGMEKYIEDHQKQTDGKRLTLEGFSGNHAYEEAVQTVKSQLGQEIPIPYLMLQHKDKERFRDFIWHWFLITGYEETPEGLYLLAATYGRKHKLPFWRLWDTGSEEKGGMILYSLKENEVGSLR